MCIYKSVDIIAVDAIREAERIKAGDAGSVMLEPRIVDNITPNVVPNIPPDR